MTIALVTHERFVDHQPGAYHPERPARLQAALDGVHRVDLDTDLVRLDARLAPLERITRVHDPALVEALQAIDQAGGGDVDPDTTMSAGSWLAARLAAGAGLVALEALDAGTADAAFCVIRPPGHHATPVRSMGFCLLNNVAVTATALADRGERVLIVDIDAHHGNGTQDAFYADPRVLFVSFHQWPLYPGTGAANERGVGDGVGTTVNIPLPPGATGDVYLQAWDRIVAPVVDAFAPTWTLVSAGFDAHRADPITELGLSAGDYAALAQRISAVAAPGRRVVFLEGGYDLGALELGTAAMVGVLAGRAVETEVATNGGPGQAQVDAVVALHR